MKLIDNILYVEYSELLDCGISESYLRKAKSVGTKCWDFVDDPDDRRRVLVGYEKLKPAYKELITARFGSPYEYMSRQPIREMIVPDLEAEKFYLAHRYGGTKKLDPEYVKKYTKAASWLNMLKAANADKKAIKKRLNLDIAQFYLTVIEMIKAEKVDLPTSYKRLQLVRKDYEENGYGCLIDWRFGNQLAAKVADEVTESVLLELLSHPNQYDDVYITMKYNEWAASAGYKTIEPATTGIWRRKLNAFIIGDREGQAAFYDKYSRQIKGHRPTAPLLLMESDDNHLDLLFTDPSDTTAHKAYHKYKAIVITDSYNDYVLGYAYAEKLTTEVARAAYLNAMYHIRELTGDWYLPHEVKTDRWAMAELKPFYEGIGHYFETPVGSKKRGYLEQFFSSPLWKRSLKAGATNYTGNNMTAVNRGVNLEELDRNKADRLTLDEGRTQVENFFARLRHTPGTSGKTKQQEWLEAWANTPDDRKRPITDEQFLLKFGVLHRPKSGKAIAITNGGVEPQILGRQYSFEVPVDLYLENVGKKVHILYDPYDMSRVLCTDFGSLRFTATASRLQPRALADYQPGDRRLLNAFLAEKLDDVKKVAARKERRKEVLREHMVDAETLLQGGIMIKELKQQAEEQAFIGLTERSNRANYNPLDQM